MCVLLEGVKVAFFDVVVIIENFVRLLLNKDTEESWESLDKLGKSLYFMRCG